MMHPGTAAPGPTDEQLMQQLQQGQTGALDRLYARYSKSLYAFCHHILRAQDPASAEDLVQDVFVRVIQSAHTFDPLKASFRTWLFRIARNRCLDLIRRHKLIQILPFARQASDKEGPAPEERLPDPGADVEHAVLQDSMTRAVRDCIAALQNEEERQAFLLYYLGDKVYREIAKIMSKSTSTARNRVQAAQDKVRRCLERKGVRPE